IRVLRQLYVWAMTDYSPQQDPTIPCADAGMSLRRGDILEMVDQTDTLWWQAKKLPSNTACAGLIPPASLLRRSDMFVQKLIQLFYETVSLTHFFKIATHFNCLDCNYLMMLTATKNPFSNLCPKN
uniref:SH3 domain-containing protein n=1 Tax=Amphilophus citrinellus TaxID=61819 RepID=A0A3Q0RCF1_AMPCI